MYEARGASVQLTEEVGMDILAFSVALGAVTMLRRSAAVCVLVSVTIPLIATMAALVAPIGWLAFAENLGLAIVGFNLGLGFTAVAITRLDDATA